MTKLNELISKCKNSVHLTVNLHRDYYETVDQHLTVEDLEDIELDVYEKMKELDTIIELQWYPDTSIGFYKIFHYDLDSAIEFALRNS